MIIGVVKSGFLQNGFSVFADYSDRVETAYYQLAEQTGGDIFILQKPKSSKLMATILKKSATLGE